MEKQILRLRSRMTTYGKPGDTLLSKKVIPAPFPRTLGLGGRFTNRPYVHARSCDAEVFVDDPGEELWWKSRSFAYARG